jgi:predicted DNA-binding transcriptional regulator YafY
MPQVKNPILRYRIINACLTNRQKRYWTKQELIDALSKQDIAIKERTLNRDIENMRQETRLGFNAPIKFCKKEYAYYYEDPNFSINKVQLSEEEQRAIGLALNLLKQYNGTQLVNNFEGAIEKLIRVVEQLRHATKSPDESFIEFEKAPYYKGMDYLDKVWAAIHKQQPLRIAYQKFTADKPDEHVFHPYLLKEYKGRFYVLGYSEARRKVIILALDRIENISDESGAYKPNTSLQAKEFFKHTLGITIGDGPVEDITLWFTPSLGHYIKTQYIHPTQKILQDDGEGLVISLQLIVNYELISLLLSHCPQVSVIKPISLRNQLSEALKKGLSTNGKFGGNE